MDYRVGDKVASAHIFTAALGWSNAIFAHAYANETANWNLLLGGGLITLANIYLQLRPSPRLEQAEAQAKL